MHFKRQHKRRIVAVLDMTPLIDVVFLLLVFFVLSSTFVAQTSVPIEIPEAEGTPSLESKDAMLVLQSGEGGPDNGGIIQISGGGNTEPLEVPDWAELTEAFTRNRLPQIVLQVAIALLYLSWIAIWWARQTRREHGQLLEG